MNINPTLIGTLSLLELVWLTVNVVGASYTFGNERNANDAYQTACTPPTDEAEVKIAQSDRFMHRVIFPAQLAYLAMGLLFAFIPPRGGAVEASVISIVQLVLIFAGPVLLMVLSAGVARFRVELNGILASYKNGD